MIYRLLSLVVISLLFSGLSCIDYGFTTPNLPINDDPYACETVGKLEEYYSKINNTEVFKLLPPKERLRDPRSSSGYVDTSKYYTSVAGIAYCSDQSLLRWNCTHCRELGGFVEVKKIMNEPKYKTRAVLAIDSDKKEISLSFRGAVNVRNWLNSLAFAKTPFPGSKGSAVHLGFKNMADAFYPIYNYELGSLLRDKRYSNYNIVITGHSLGGALATFAALYIQQSQGISWDRISLYTYAQPRVGNYEFAIWYNRLPFIYSRYVNSHDPVPHAPPAFAGYSHPFTEIFEINEEARVCDRRYLEDPTCSDSTVPFFSVNDHSYAFGIGLGSDMC